MSPTPSSGRVSWVVDNGSSHAGRASVEWLEGGWRKLRLIHISVHASWINQIEPYSDRAAQGAHVERLRLAGGADRAPARIPGAHAEIARPFEWTFDRPDLERVIERVDYRRWELGLAA